MTPPGPPPASRWQNYVLERGPGLAQFWQSHLG